MALVKWVTGTSDKYKALSSKDPNALYFLSDTNEIYKGDALYTESIVFVSSFPASGALGKVYVSNSTLEGKVWNGTSWKTVIQQIANSITDDTNTGVPSAEAVKQYVLSKMGQAGIGNFVENITFDKASKEISYVKDGTTTKVPIDGFLTGASYNGTNGNLTFTIEGSTDISINLPKDNFVKSGIYDSGTKEIVLTLVDNNEVRIPASDLVDVYTASNTSTVSMSVTGKNIEANVNISKESGNELIQKADGLYVVGGSSKLDKVTLDKVDEIITANDDGTIKTSGKKIGGATLKASPDANTLATEAALVEYAISKTDIATSLNESAPSAAKLVSEKAVVDALTWSVI